jgi:hypothetical protein
MDANVMRNFGRQVSWDPDVEENPPAQLVVKRE